MSINKVLEDLKKLKNVYYEAVKVSVGKELTLTLQLLTSEEETDVHAQSLKYDQGLAYLYSVKRETLCRSIIAINNKEIPSIIEDEDEKETLNLERHDWIKKNIVSGWSQVIIDHVWENYAKLLENLDKKLRGEVKEEEPKI